MQQQELQQLVRKYFSGTADEGERNALLDWYRSLTVNEVEWLAEYADEEERLRAAMLQNILKVTGLEKPAPVRRLWPRVAAAASILLVLSVASYFTLHKTHHSPLTAHHNNNDIKPGHNQATLTLADGRKIILRRGLNGTLARQGNSSVHADSSAIFYTTTTTPSPLERARGEAMNTLSTARGEQSPYPLVLADGTKVWLNAESTLTFPAEFKGADRTVKLTGEAYFEVIHNEKKPFRVIAGDKTIEDIGTAFDINAYSDEPVFKTTVLSGTVSLSTKTPSPLERVGVRLTPGQQVSITTPSPDGKGRAEAVKIRTVNPQNAIAWKNGLFRLDERPLGEIMREAARWYDVEVTYSDESLKFEAFGGVTARGANITLLLHQLELTNVVRFKMDGRKIRITGYNRP